MITLGRVSSAPNTGMIEEMVEGWKKGDEEMMTYGIERAFDNETRKVRKQARAEGKAEGIAEGIAEGKREVALNLLALNVSIGQIAEATGLTEEELEELKKSGR